MDPLLSALDILKQYLITDTIQYLTKKTMDQWTIE